MARRYTFSERGRARWEALTREEREAFERAAAARAAEPPDDAAERADVPPITAPAALVALGTALRAERERQGLSLADVAERTRLGRSVLCRLEGGKVPNPTLSTLRAYARALGMRVALELRPGPE
jgi:ribosome-binding protein aMBF1 (putative translation factor)